MTSTTTLSQESASEPESDERRRAPDTRRHSVFGGTRAFFRHHGVWAPAVRLLRRLPLPGKVAVVASGFLAAALLLGAAYSQKALKADRAARVAVDGARVLQALAPLQEAAWLAGGQSPRTGDSQANRFDPAALEALSRLFASSGSGDPDPMYNPGTDAAWERLQAAWAAASRPGAEPPSGEPADRRVPAIDLRLAISDYRDRIVSSSGLLRSSEPEVYWLASLASSALPALADSLVIASLASEADANGQGREATAARLGIERVRLQWRLIADTSLSVSSTQGEAVERTLDRADAAMLAARNDSDARFQELTLLALGDIARLERDLAASLEAVLHQRLQEGRRQLLSLGLVVLLLLGIGVYLLAGFHRVMAGGLRSLSSEVRRMARGDLSARPTPRGDDEVAEALQSLGGSLAMLSDMFATVRQGVASVAQASEAIARGNGELALRTDRTTEQLRQVVAGVNLYMDQLDQSARRVEEAAGMVDRMRLEAARSRSNMGQLQSRMQALQARSREIATFVEVIDSISFRTNVLALNASIEAAKAGETGRGFAVVAQEVRRLAQRSAESARSIQDIVARSTEDIVQGAALADRTGEALQATDVHVTRVHESMKQIVQLTRGGETNSHAILESIHELDHLTHENGSLVEQIAQASVALSGSGNELSRRVEGFKLG